jgi:hypothetical protein
MRSGNVLASLAVLLILSGCDRHREDAEIMNTAIRHLSEKLAENSHGRGGILLVHTQTQSWTEQSLKFGRKIFPQDSQSVCRIPEELYRALIESAAEMPVIRLLDESKEWRIAPAWVEARKPSLPPEEIDGIPVTAMAAVSMPGYSSSNNEALILVSLSFPEEMHGSVARIRLMRSTTGWRVKCVQPNFYM